MVSSGGERFIIPQVSLLELLRLEGEAGTKQIRTHSRRARLPAARDLCCQSLTSRRSWEFRPVRRDEDVINIVVLQAENRQFGLVVDEINDTQEIVVKPLGKQFRGLNGLRRAQRLWATARWP